MKRHELRFYAGDLNVGPTLPLLIWIPAVVAFIIGGIAAMPSPSYLWGIWLMVSGLVAFVVNTVLYKTHINRELSAPNQVTWNKYKSLNAETRSNIGLTWEAVSYLTRNEVGIIEQMLKTQKEEEYQNSKIRIARERLRDEYEVQQKVKELV